jgi:hypothetical protein
MELYWYNAAREGRGQWRQWGDKSVEGGSNVAGKRLISCFNHAFTDLPFQHLSVMCGIDILLINVRKRRKQHIMLLLWIKFASKGSLLCLRGRCWHSPFKKAKMHGNEPSRGAKIDAQIQAEEEEELKRKGKA